MGFVTLLGGFILHLVCGCFYLTGIINIYIVSYLRKFNEELNMNSMIIILPTIVIFQTTFMGLGPFLLRWYNQYVPMVTGSIIICLGTFLASFSQSLTWYVIFFACFMGVGNGMCYITPIILGWEYFPNNKGFVSGVISCGFGLASFIYTFVAEAIVNPENAKPSVDTLGGKVYRSDSD